MKGKQQPTKNTVGRTKTTNKVCPRCGNDTLHRSGTRPSGKVQWICRAGRGDRTHCYSTVNPRAKYRGPSGNDKEPDKNPKFKRALGGAKKFVITSAQNATPVHDAFFRSLTKYCEVNGAELVVIPIRYKNPTSKWTDSQASAEIWDPAVTPFLYNGRKKLNENLILMGDIKTIPTASKPLSGFEGITHGESGIFGHTKLQMQSIATPQGKYPKILTTTGACTMKNYTDSKAGKKGEFHHSLAALVVEIVGKKFFMRHVNADGDGSFIDLQWEYNPTSVQAAPPALALVFGDTHRAFIDKKVESATYSPGGMVDVLNPDTLVFHDLHDGYAENPHHFGNPFVQLAKNQSLMNNVRNEIIQDVIWLAKTIGKRDAVIIPSNHDNFLWRWIVKSDWREDVDNAEFYLETALHMVKETKMDEGCGSSTPDPFTYWVDKLKGNAPITCLKRDQSFVLGGVELSLHGDQGANGSRGSRENLRKIGVKTIIGHSHTPGIEEGCYQAGTSTGLKLEYNTGPSSWLQAHVVLYGNGKRAILPIIDGAWCFDDAKK